MRLYIVYVETYSGNRFYCHETDESKASDWLWRMVTLLAESNNPPELRTSVEVREL